MIATPIIPILPQALQKTATPTFAGLNLGTDGYVKAASGSLLLSSGSASPYLYVDALGRIRVLDAVVGTNKMQFQVQATFGTADDSCGIRFANYDNAQIGYVQAVWDGANDVSFYWGGLYNGSFRLASDHLMRLNSGGSLSLLTSGASIVLPADGTIYNTNGPTLTWDSDATAANRKLSGTGGALLWSGTDGGTPASGAGTRMEWIPAKGAFRAGVVTSTQWDDASVGSNSTAFGYNCTASAAYAFAAGNACSAVNLGASAFGYYAYAAGNYSFAAGYGATAGSAGTYSAAIGQYAYTSNRASIAFGHYVKSSGLAAIALGFAANSNYNLEASGQGAIAAGNATGYGTLKSTGQGCFCAGSSMSLSATGVSTLLASGSGGSFAQGYVYGGAGKTGIIQATNYGSFAQGYAVDKTLQATGAGAFAHGYASAGNITASGQNSVAVGDNVVASQTNAVAFGVGITNATANSFRVGWTANGGIHLIDQELKLYDTNAAFVLDCGTTNGVKIGKTTGDKLGFFAATPIVQPSALTAALTTITHTAPSTPDYAIQDFIDVAGDGSQGFSFTSIDEANSVLAVVANLQTRVGELEAKLNATTGLGLIA